MNRPIRPYIPLVYGPREAKAEMEESPNDVKDLPRQIATRLLGAKLTPLQAQAVLVRAWEIVQREGCLSIRDHQPKEIG